MVEECVDKVPPSKPFSIITFNILHPDYALQERYPDCKHLDWDYRKDLIYDILTKEKYHLILLQEVDYLLLSYFVEKFPDYAVLTQEHKPRTRDIAKWKADPSRKKPNTMVVATLVYRERFEVIQSHTKTRSLTVYVKDKENGVQISITNIHLDAHRGNSDSADLRLKHLQSIQTDLLESGIDCRIVCGDFNDFIGSPPLEFMRKNGFIYGYKTIPEATFRTHRRAEVIDHLFYSGGFKIIANWTDIYGIPNYYHPSDHIPVIFRVHSC